MPPITHPDLLDLGRRLAAPTPAERDIEMPVGIGEIGETIAAEFLAGAVVNLLSVCRKSGVAIKAIAGRARDRPIMGVIAKEKVRTAVEDAMLSRPSLASEDTPEWRALRTWAVARIIDAGAGESVSSYDIDRIVRAASSIHQSGVDDA